MINQRDHAVEVFVCLLAVLQLLIIAGIAREETVGAIKILCYAGASVYFCFAILYAIKEIRSIK